MAYSRGGDKTGGEKSTFLGYLKASLFPASFLTRIPGWSWLNLILFLPTSGASLELLVCLNLAGPLLIVGGGGVEIGSWRAGRFSCAPGWSCNGWYPWKGQPGQWSGLLTSTEEHTTMLWAQRFKRPQLLSAIQFNHLFLLESNPESPPGALVWACSLLPAGRSFFLGVRGGRWCCLVTPGGWCKMTTEGAGYLSAEMQLSCRWKPVALDPIQLIAWSRSAPVVEKLCNRWLPKEAERWLSRANSRRDWARNGLSH